MTQFSVSGMSCAACIARVEKAVMSVPGVTACTVSLLTNSMGVEGTVDSQAIISAVEKAGYAARPKDRAAKEAAQSVDPLADNETPVLKQRLLVSLFFLLPLMYVSMGHVMWSWPLPNFFASSPVAVGLLQLLLSGFIIVINQKFFINGAKGILHRSPNMDTLVALGSGTSFLYSVCILFVMCSAQAQANFSHAIHLLHELYFESAAMILTLITVGKMLEAHAKGKTTSALKNLMQLSPHTATLIIDGTEISVPVDQVKKDDLFVVYPGEKIPVDGVVLEGCSAVNEASLTGESLPVDKTPGDQLFSATINQSGFLRCKATRVGEDTTLSQIIKLVSEAAATKAPIAKVADKVSSVFVPAVLSIAFVTTIVWLLLGETFGFSLARGISVLVISCPCALGLATPVAIMVGNGAAAKHGILFKTASALEETGKIRIIALDKTGTITNGKPRVTDVLAAEGCTEEYLLQTAFSLEALSEHPLSHAIVQKAKSLHFSPEEITEFKVLPGNGLTGKRRDAFIAGGNDQFVMQYAPNAAAYQHHAFTFASQGKTPLYFAENDRFLGLIAVADTIKEDSSAAIHQLQDMGIRVVMLTGDNEKTANEIGRQAGVDEVIAGVLPDGKEAAIQRLKQNGKVAMVGDGINDAPALTRADIGIAIAAGTDIAIDAADIVLMNSSLNDVPAAIRLSRATLKNIHENLFWAFLYNTLGIPLAAGAFISLLGWKMNPMFGAAAMSLSSFCVVSNALRLNFFDLYSTAKDKIIKHQKEDKPMEKVMKINGMMCPHCSGRVKTVLEALPEVSEAVVSHETGTATLTLNAPVADDILKKTVEDQGYEVVE